MYKTLKYLLALILVVSLSSFFACSDLLEKFTTTSIIPITTTQAITTTTSPATTLTSSTTTGTSTPTPSTTSSVITPLASTTTFVANGKLEVYYLDVGQGDSEIIRCGSNTMLIDAGTNASTTILINDIKELGITKFDVVVGITLMKIISAAWTR